MALKTHEEIEQLLKSLTPEEFQALNDYAVQMAKENAVVPVTVSSTDAGPLISPVSVNDAQSTRKRLMSVANSVSAPAGTKPKGLEMSKSVVQDGDSYKITLEAYTTGAVTKQAIPADIVLVLDQSGSMSENFSANSSGSKQDALKGAVTSFIDAVANDNMKNRVDHKIAIVTFSSKASVLGSGDFSDSYDSLKTIISGLKKPSGATDFSAGMSKANDLIKNVYTDTNRNKIVIVFTDGVPTQGSNFDTSVANSALEYSKAIKNMGATIYSVGIFNGANRSQLYGDAFEYAIPALNVPCSGNIGDIWGATIVTEVFGDVRFIDEAAGNRFLNYLSSNYVTNDQYGIPNEIGIDSGLYNPNPLAFLSFGPGYQITKNFTRTYSNYYLSASDASVLNTAFTNISKIIVSPTTPLGSSVEVRDVIEQYFDLSSEPKAWIVPRVKGDNGFTWGDPKPFTAPQVSTNKQSITESGFDFDNLCVTDKQKLDSTYGSKLVISFNIVPKDGFWGGNGVPTNKSESGIYSNNAMVWGFDIPHVNVELKVPFSGNNKSIYLGNKVCLDSLYNPITAPKGTDSWKAAFIDFSEQNKPTYAASISTPLPDRPTGDLMVTVIATIRLLNSNDYITKEISSNIIVFKPVITCFDSSIYLGNQAESYIGKNLHETDVVWKHGDSSSDSDKTLIGDKPTLTYTFSTPEGYFTADTPVNITVSTDGLGNITPYTTFFNGKNGHTGTSSNGEFTVNVYKPVITFADSSLYLGMKEMYDTNFKSLGWKHGDTTASSDMSGAPELKYTYLPVEDKDKPSDGYFTADTPVNVKVEVKTGTLGEITPYVTFVNNNNTHSGTASDAEFNVTIKTCTLTLTKTFTKSGCIDAYGDGQSFIMQITGANSDNCKYADDVKQLTVVINGNGSKTITGLPVGNYTVIENGVWSWRYTASSPEAKLSCDSDSGIISVVNTPSKLFWLSGCDSVANIFAKKAG